MSIKRRVERLEAERADGGEGWTVLRCNLAEPGLYRDAAGNEYRRGVNWPSGNVLLIERNIAGDLLPANWHQGRP